jgi:hypothetical protein
MAAGTARQIGRYARRRLDAAEESLEADWWRLVIDTLEGAMAVP